MGSTILSVQVTETALAKGPALATDRPSVREVRHEPLPLGSGKSIALGPDPRLALVLAVLVGLAVFALIWRVRKTFGMKD